ncbi:MAG TPA: hypothetical protein VHM31_22360 [Polyangia bacterium]|nr:hypothetical protein [Polyangia bacterium]
MTDPGNGSSPDVRALLQREREITPVPMLVRARVMARARAAIAAGPAVYTARPRHAPVRWAVAAGVIFVAAGAVGAAAYEMRVRLDRQAPPQTAVAALARPAPAAPLATAPAAEPDIAPPPVVGAAHLSRTDAAREELRLLRKARAAVARQDYAAALPLLAEDARRFKDGRFVEEREALRVRALAGLGRTEEARRAAERFQERFPRSVLLPAVRQMSTAGR